jgi:threonylcarbamoyladenosine tRNA methylthiotransferase CDKAL1
MKIFIETFGCPSNKDNSEIMKSLLLKHELVDSAEKADTIIINTCTVIHKTEQKMISRIRKYKNKKLIITGCMATTQKELLKKEAPSASIINTHNITKIEQALKKQVVLIKRRKEEKVGIKKNNNIIQILQGCKGACTFCITRLEKGKLYSYSKKKILESFKEAIKHHKTIYLTSQDNACYGLDKNEISKLPELLRDILKIGGKYQIRIGMMNPQHTLPILKELIEIYKDTRTKKFIHIPMQSGSNKILKEMNRFHSVEDFKKIVKVFRKEIPSIHIATDIIVAYPTETEADFKKTLKLIKEIKPEVINISRFTPRPGTPAARLKQHLSEVAKERSRKLSLLIKDL